eukprot:CAMPEP_0179160698 /NCGR_PEP_ID=MMETSP0796-20121207/78603_1 /TAXON_ID=73915 /ORGANISM="Pyrodinium bahamense, Strain pbaha01" /LENGTH=68 /DNA_ID=CAMNT_0020862695 /DNA_START=89 /DNA_END=295 /DNA_ORIENTATION=+
MAIVFAMASPWGDPERERLGLPPRWTGVRKFVLYRGGRSRRREAEAPRLQGRGRSISVELRRAVAITS